MDTLADVLTLERHERLSPSRIVKRCLRDAVMDSLGYPALISPKTQAAFDEGTRLHKKMQEVFSEHLGLRDCEMEVFCTDPPIYGHVDGILEVNNSPILFEMKTTSKKCLNIESPIDDHVDQAQLYMHMTGIDRTWIYYYSKPDEDVKHFVIDKDDARILELLDRASYLIGRIEKRRLPSCCSRCNNPACNDRNIWAKEGLRSGW